MTRYKIAEMLKSKRKALGLSAAEVTKAMSEYGIDISPKTLYGWENGHRQPDADAFLTLCNIYGISSLPKSNLDVDALTSEYYTMIQKYRDLDDHGQEMVDIVLEKEHQRCTMPAALDVIPMQKPHEIVDLYEFLAPVSAGFGVDLSDIDGAVHTKVISNVYTKKADFILRVDGESMAPSFHNGDKILVQETDDIEIGEIGIWYVNGKHYVKKKGEGRLISLNRKFPDIYPEEAYEQRCQGRVIGILDPNWIIEENVEEQSPAKS